MKFRNPLVKASYAADGRTYCEGCGNSDVEMESPDDTLCYNCKHPKETEDQRQAEMNDCFYVYGEPDMP